MKDQVREAWQNGESRSAIAKRFGVTYQRVFALTKGVEGGPEGSEAGGRARVIVAESEKLTEAGKTDLVGKPRAEAIRELYEDGMKLGDIARLLDTSYQVAFQATKSIRAGESGDEDGDEADVEDTDSETEEEVETESDEDFDLTDDADDSDGDDEDDEE
jgi:transposase-like protein